MATLTVRNLPDEVHRALRVRAAQHGRSTEAEIREILTLAVRPAGQLVVVVVVLCWLGGTEQPAISAPISIKSTVFIFTSVQFRIMLPKDATSRNASELE